MGVQPRRVLEATLAGARYRSEPWRITPADFFSEVEKLRAAFARLVNCSSDNIAIVPSAGYGVAIAAANIDLKPGGTILAMYDQFPSNYYAWRRKTLEADAGIHIVNKEAGQTWADALVAAIDEFGDRIAVATLEGHHWASADAVDLDVVIAALREVGARVVLDLTQTIGACPVDVGKLAPDFMVAAGYKWQFSPYGIAYLYADENYFDGIPIEEGWINRDGAEDFSRLAEFTDAYQPGARRYDVSQKSSFSNIAGALAGQEAIAEWGVETIAKTLADTNERIAAILDSHGFETVPESRRGPHFQGARLPETDPRKLAAKLIDQGVYASVRGDNLRVAPHLYTDDEDLARFDQALAKALA